jgi:putative ABC transport system permease protein
MTTFWNDVKYGLRTLWKNPGFTAVAVLTLALGIGTCTAVFTLLNAVVLSELPYREPDRLVRVWDSNQKRNLTSFPASIPNFLSWQQRSRELAGFAAWRYGTATAGAGAQAERLNVTRISANLLPLIGCRPVAGRGFLPEEDQPGRDREVLLSRHYWQERFAGHSSVIGRELLLDGVPHTVVGIAPRELESLVGADLWRPLAPDPAKDPRGMHHLRVVGRLRPGVSMAAAQAEMTGIAGQLAKEFPDSNAHWGIRLESFSNWIVPSGVRTALSALFAAAGCVLLIACANVANLLLVRTHRRHQELALRTALGASRWRLFRQMLVENATLTALGASVGILFAYWSLHLLHAFPPQNLPRLDEVRFDGPVLLIAGGLSLLSALGVSAVSVLASAGADLQQFVKQGARGGGAGVRHRFVQRGLVAGQLAMSLMLLIGAALLAQSFARLLDNDLGFQPDHLLTFQVSPPAPRYSRAASLQYYQRLIESLDSLPGVATADLTSGPPFFGEMFRFTSRMSTEQSPVFPSSELLSMEFSHVGPRYFEAIGATMVEGRAFTAADNRQSQGVAILNEAAARAFWPEGGAVGKTVFWGDPLQVVGVVRDLRNTRRDLPARPALYLSANQQLWSTMVMVVRYTGHLDALIPAIRREAQAIDPEVPIFDVRTMPERVSDASAQARFSTGVLGAFAVGALALALVGLYGVTSCVVVERTHEFGVRMALGALPGDVRRLVLGQHAAVLVGGLLAGVAISLAGARLLSGLLYEIRPMDLPTFAGAAVVLAVASTLAVLIAARRATRVNPMEALRCE